ncbi:hypothetical protein PR048_011895 [Dryococelus australis]|uniref:Uncharacterized protein n=1 Tax=Dryococelus australis TaxID=614101 RepID=A0ABQ9HN72_9NEOP|nr:hypothetical protein PR048_011895 [Dryococelus australis]
MILQFSLGPFILKKGRIIQNMHSRSGQYLFYKLFLKCEEAKCYAYGINKLMEIINKMLKQHDTSVVSVLRMVLFFWRQIDGTATGKKIGEVIIPTITEHKIPLKNCLALGSNNAAIMTRSKNGVAANLKQHQENVVVLEKVSEGLMFNVNEILIDIYYYLDKCSKRRNTD